MQHGQRRAVGLQQRIVQGGRRDQRDPAALARLAEAEQRHRIRRVGMEAHRRIRLRPRPGQPADQRARGILRQRGAEMRAEHQQRRLGRRAASSRSRSRPRSSTKPRPCSSRSATPRSTGARPGSAASPGRSGRRGRRRWLQLRHRLGADRHHPVGRGEGGTGPDGGTGLGDEAGGWVHVWHSSRPAGRQERRGRSRPHPCCRGPAAGGSGPTDPGEPHGHPRPRPALRCRGDDPRPAQLGGMREPDLRCRRR